MSVDEIEALKPSHIILSPGPGRPADAGVCEAVALRFAGKIPILGVCLGHQAICEAFGAEVTYASELIDLPVVIVPTSASTDAPTSAMSVIYNERHEHDDVYYYIKSPDMVLVDSEIIANAPVRFLVSGMGDALATVFEARASVNSNSPNYICGESGTYRRSRTGIAIAEASYQILLENGVNAKIANENHIVTEALEAVIEANTLMSGLGFENVGCAGSHVVCNGLTAAPGGEKALHGEKVAFGVICQLLAENASLPLLNEVLNFNQSVGLPITLADMGIEATEENYDIIASDTANTEWTREPFYMNDTMVKAIVKSANALGMTHKK